MSFFNKAFSVAKAIATTVATSIEEKATEINTKTVEYEEKTDEELLRYIHSGDGFFLKVALKKLSLQKCYDNEDIRLKI